MRRYLWLAGCCVAFAAHAGSGTLRVGSQVLTVGDSATRVTELLGKPSYKGHAKSTSASHARGRKSGKGQAAASGGEQWQYREGQRVVSILIVDGKVASIRDDGH